METPKLTGYPVDRRIVQRRERRREVRRAGKQATRRWFTWLG